MCGSHRHRHGHRHDHMAAARGPYEGGRPERASARADVRVGDAERERAMEALNDHFAAGRLEAEELSERLGRAGAARTRADLDALFADLPGRIRSGTRGREAAGHGGPPVGMMITLLLVAVAI